MMATKEEDVSHSTATILLNDIVISPASFPSEKSSLSTIHGNARKTTRLQQCSTNPALSIGSAAFRSAYFPERQLARPQVARFLVANFGRAKTPQILALASRSRPIHRGEAAPGDEEARGSPLERCAERRCRKTDLLADASAREGRPRRDAGIRSSMKSS